jgi:hypothetical protein
MFVERYLELSSELKYRKGEGGAYMQLGQILSQKGDFDTSTRHFYRAMKIAEEIGDAVSLIFNFQDQKEEAKVNFGMANANLKWNGHMGDILKNLDESRVDEDHEDDESEAGANENI